ncbi:hypothetical protein K8Q94_01540 [Candidatus Nomurabacteria bacterium]|nr:hypothetical protein [Candidatus Nomurabacteria bacterium]
MQEMQNIKWQALEYEEKERHTDWFWALGIIVVAGATTAIIFANYFFAILIVLSGLSLAFLAIKKPSLIDHELNNDGLQIHTEFYPYKKMKSFWIKKENDPMLLIKTSKIFMPIISVPIKEMQIQSIEEKLFSNKVLKEEIKENVTEKIIDTLGL